MVPFHEKNHSLLKFQLPHQMRSSASKPLFIENYGKIEIIFQPMLEGGVGAAVMFFFFFLIKFRKVDLCLSWIISSRLNDRFYERMDVKMEIT